MRKCLNQGFLGDGLIFKDTFFDGSNTVSQNSGTLEADNRPVIFGTAHVEGFSVFRGGAFAYVRPCDLQ